MSQHDDERAAERFFSIKPHTMTPSPTNADLGELVAELRAWPGKPDALNHRAADRLAAQQREIEGLRNAVEQWKANTGQLATERDALRAKLDRAAEAITGEKLYLAHWRRNGWEIATPWADQADAIRTMWDNIAKDAFAELPQEGGNV